MVYTAHRSKSIIAGVLDLKYMRVPVRRESSRNKIAFLFYLFFLKCETLVIDDSVL